MIGKIKTKELLYIGLVGFFIYLFLSNIFTRTVEPMENAGDKSTFDLQAAVASNKGNIDSLRDQINNMLKNMQGLMSISSLEKDNSAKLDKLEDDVEKMKNNVSLNSRAISNFGKAKSDSVRNTLSMKN